MKNYVGLKLNGTGYTCDGVQWPHLQGPQASVQVHL